MLDFGADADIVAPQLLGCTLSYGAVTIEITEVEAYLHGTDEAAHSFRGKTPANAALWGPGGHLYVYISYGIHRCCNLVCGPDGTGQGCLIRAGRVLSGEEEARSRRGAVSFARLASGPGNVGKALGLGTEHNHLPVHKIPSEAVGTHVSADQPRHPRLGARAQEPEWVAGPRIGISKNVDAPLRFWIPGDQTVTSPKRPPKK